MTNIFYRQYVQPFRNLRLSVTYLSLFFGILAGSFLSVYAAIDTVKAGAAGLIAFYYVWFILAGFVFFPLFFLLFRNFSRRVFIGTVLGTQIVGTVLLFLKDGAMQPWHLGVVMALFGTGYWQMHHINLAAYTSREGRGFEVSLANTLTQAAHILGGVFAGMLSQHEAGASVSLIVAFGAQLAATLGLALSSPRAVRATDTSTPDIPEAGHVLLENFRDIAWRFPRQNIGTALSAVMALVFVIMLPAWLKIIGLSGTMIGFIRGGQAIVTSVLSPYAGKLTQEESGREFKISALSGVVGWMLPLAASFSAPMVALSSLCLAASSLFFSTGIEARWYVRRSMTQILVREIILTVARIVFVPVVALLAFGPASGYALFGLAVAVLAWPMGIWLGKARMAEVKA